MSGGSGLIGKIAPYSLYVLIGGSVIVSGGFQIVSGLLSRDNALSPVEASGPSDTAKAVLENQESILKALQASSPDAVQAISTERVLSSVDSRFSAFDDAAYSVWESMIREKAAVIYLEVHGESQATGRSVELLLSQRLNYLKDREYASAQKHNGRVNYANQDDVDTVAGQLVEKMAIAHLINRLVNGQMPSPEQTDISVQHMGTEGLSKALFEMQAQNIALVDASPPQISPPSSVSQEIQSSELTEYRH